MNPRFLEFKRETVKSRLLRLKNKRKRRYRRRRLDRTTLIIGMKCPEGVALVADRKVFDTESARETYEKKIIAPLNLPVFVGAAGLTDLFREFNRKIPIVVQRRQMMFAIENQKILQSVGLDFKDFLVPPKEPEKIQSIEEPAKEPPKETKKEQILRPPYIYTGEDFLDDCKKLIKEISKEKKELGYSYPLEVLLGFNAGVPVLFFIDCDGSESQVETYKAIGSGSQYVRLFFERLWNPNRPIGESVMLACIVIKFVEEMDLDKYVGVGENNVPQVALILNDGKVGEFEVNKKPFLDESKAFNKVLDSFIRNIKFTGQSNL